MKLTIDLNDPEVQKQLELAIEAKLQCITAEAVQATVERVLETKMSRLTDERVIQLAAKSLENRIGQVFMSGWNSPSEFQQVLAKATEKLLRERLKPAE